MGRDTFHQIRFLKPIQPSLEHFQGWGIHNFSGNLFQCLTTIIVKNLFLIPDVTLSLIIKIWF